MTRRLPSVSGKRILIALAGTLAAALALGLHYFGHYQPFADLLGPRGPDALSQSSLLIRQATVSGRSDGRLRWRVHAETITLSADRSQVTALGIHDGVLYGTSGQPIFRMSAGRAQYQKPFGAPGGQFFPSGGSLTLDGSVMGRAARRDGPTLHSPMLVWDASGSIVRAVGPTTAHFPAAARVIGGLTVQAPELLWDTSHFVLRAPGTVTAIFPDGVSRVQGDDIQVDTQSGDLSLHRLHGTFRVPNALN